MKKYILFFIFLSVTILSFCQTESNLKLLTSAEDFKLQERVLLTLNQDFYLAGESVDFCALTFDAALQIPIDFSSVLYVELINQDNNIVNSKKYQLMQGECINKLSLPRQIETGYYYVRAYTNYMKNFGPGVFYTQKIKVINPFYRIKYQENAEIVSGKTKFDISAEGGKIVYGIDNKLVFYSSNLTDTLTATLFKNDSIIAKSINQKGFGVFNINPSINNKYRIEATSLKKEKVVVELKNIVQSGVICKLDSVNNKLAFLNVITKNFDNFPISVFVENNTLLYKYPNTVNDQASNLKINLPIGLNKIILKSNNNEVVSERLVYIKPVNKLEFTAKIDKSKGQSGDSVMLHINANKNDSINYVVAINLGNQLTSPPLAELFESTLNATSLAEYTDNVTYDELQFISSDSKNINDYLLKYQNSLPLKIKPKGVHYLPEINNNIITGTVMKQSDQSLAANKSIYLSFADSIAWINRSNTDSLGKFTAILPIEYQGTKLIATVRDTTNNYILKLDDEFYPDFLKLKKENYYPDTSLKEIIESRMLNLQIDDAYSSLNKNTKSQRSTLRFYGDFDSEYKFKKYLVPNLEEFISEIVQKATIVKNGKHSEVRVFKKSEHSIIGDKPMIILDGIPISNFDKIALIPAEKFEFIRIVSSKFFFGSGIFDGIVDVSSISKSFDLVDLDKNSTKFTFNPVITNNDNNFQQNTRTPNYLSDIYFKNINSQTGNENIVVRLPQNSGVYSLTIFGYNKNGESGSLSLPNVLTISH